MNFQAVFFLRKDRLLGHPIIDYAKPSAITPKIIPQEIFCVSKCFLKGGGVELNSDTDAVPATAPRHWPEITSHLVNGIHPVRV